MGTAYSKSYSHTLDRAEVDATYVALVVSTMSDSSSSGKATPDSATSASAASTQQSTLEQARKFLQDDEVRQATRERKVEFLKSKGIDEAHINQLLAEEESSETATKVTQDYCRYLLRMNNGINSIYRHSQIQQQTSHHKLRAAQIPRHPHQTQPPKPNQTALPLSPTLSSSPSLQSRHRLLPSTASSTRSTALPASPPSSTVPARLSWPPWSRP